MTYHPWAAFVPDEKRVPVVMDQVRTLNASARGESYLTTTLLLVGHQQLVGQEKQLVGRHQQLIGQEKQLIGPANIAWSGELILTVY